MLSTHITGKEFFLDLIKNSCTRIRKRQITNRNKEQENWKGTTHTNTMVANVLKTHGIYDKIFNPISNQENVS